MRLCTVLAVLAVFLGALAWPPASRAAAAEDAEALIKQGIGLRRAGKDREALVLFQRALEQQPTPKALAQVGLCEHAVGLWVAAETHLEEALRQEKDPWIRKNKAVLQGALDYVKGKLGSIEIWGTPDGAVVTVDDQPAGTLPMSRPARAPEGARTVKIEAPGFVADSRTVEVRRGEMSREHVALVAVAAPPPPPPPRPTGRPHSQPELTQEAGTDLTPKQPSDPAGAALYERWWFWTLIGAVALGAGVSIYFIARGDGECRECL
jgi:hypothetical protein